VSLGEATVEEDIGHQILSPIGTKTLSRRSVTSLMGSIAFLYINICIIFFDIHNS